MIQDSDSLFFCDDYNFHDFRGFLFPKFISRREVGSFLRLILMIFIYFEHFTNLNCNFFCKNLEFWKSLISNSFEKEEKKISFFKNSIIYRKSCFFFSFFLHNFLIIDKFQLFVSELYCHLSAELCPYLSLYSSLCQFLQHFSKQDSYIHQIQPNLLLISYLSFHTTKHKSCFCFSDNQKQDTEKLFSHAKNLLRIFKKKKN